MPRKALSLSKKNQLDRKLYKECMTKAVALYRHQLELDKKERLGLRKVCAEMEKQYLRDYGIHVKLNHNTLRNLVNGGQLQMDSNAEKSWLTGAEADEIIKYTIELAEMGFGLDHQRLKEHVDEIGRARWGNRFPEAGVGKKWTSRFIEKHSDQLHMYNGRALDTQRGRAANDITHQRYFDLVEETQLRGDGGQPIVPECTWAMDESGFQANGDEGVGRQKIIGRTGKKIQYQQQGGSRENITVLVTIGADGTALPPAVLFAGKGYLVKWKQDNPANALLGYSKKGWTDNTIGIEYAKHFELQTRSKAQGRTRVLYLDGHGSHITRAFLEHCRKHKISVICYPAHTTHIYQGLDVVIFGPLKTEYGKGRDYLLRETGEHISKENFLLVYGKAHLAALKPSLIQTAFAATGLIPFNREAISKDKFAPSRDTSFRHFTPVEPPTPVRIMTDLLMDTVQSPHNSDGEGEENHISIQRTQPLRHAIPELMKTNVRFLISESPIKATMQLPNIPSIRLSPVKAPTKRGKKTSVQELLSACTYTVLEKDLQDALVTKTEEAAILRSQVLKIQAAMVLQRMYCGRIRRQLNARDTKDKKGKRKGRVLADGESKLLTSDVVFAEIEEYEARQDAEAQLLVARRRAKEDYNKAVQAWNTEEEERKKKNELADLQWKHDLDEWKEERQRAKARKEKLKDWDLTHRKPKQKDYHIEGNPKPKMKKINTADIEDNESSESEWEDESDGEE